MITLDGKALIDFKIIAKSGHSHPSTPSFYEKTIEIPEMDGLYYISTKNGVKKFGFPMAVNEKDRPDSQKILRYFIDFFHDKRGKKRLVKMSFDYEPEKYYHVRLSAAVQPTRDYKIWEFDLDLTAYDPWAYALATAYDPSDAEDYDTETEYDTEVEYINQTYTPFVNEKQYVGIYNYSPYNTPFSFVIEGAVTNPSITNTTTGEKMTFDGLTLATDERLYVDSKRKTTWKIKATEDQYYWLTPNQIIKYPSQWAKYNVYHEHSGDWIELTTEGNTLLFEGTSPNGDVNFNWEHRFL